VSDEGNLVVSSLHVEELACPCGVPASHVEVGAVELEADWSCVWLSFLGDGRNAGKPLRAQVGDLFIGERHRVLLPARAAARCSGVQRTWSRRGGVPPLTPSSWVLRPEGAGTPRSGRRARARAASGAGEA